MSQVTLQNHSMCSNTPNYVVDRICEDCNKIAIISSVAYGALISSTCFLLLTLSKTSFDVFLTLFITGALTYVAGVCLAYETTEVALINLSFLATQAVAKKTYSLISHDSKSIQQFNSSVDNLSSVRSNLFFKSLKIAFIFCSVAMIFPLPTLASLSCMIVSSSVCYSLLEFSTTALFQKIRG